jgi:hypothetical protein
MGNPVVWISGALALIVAAIRSRRSRPALVTAGLTAALWLPWVLPSSEPYSYYGAILVPVLATATAQALDLARWRQPASILLGLSA